MKRSSVSTKPFTLIARCAAGNAMRAGLLVCATLLCVRVGAQVSGGALSGTVTASQLAVPKARVTLRNVATGVELDLPPRVRQIVKTHVTVR